MQFILIGKINVHTRVLLLLVVEFHSSDAQGDYKVVC